MARFKSNPLRSQIDFKSELEVNNYKFMRKANRKLKIGYEVDKIKYSIPRHYIPDFTITRPDGTKLYIETKGYFRPADRAKMRAVKTQNPTLDIRFVFEKDKKVYKNSTFTYSQWAEKYNFPWAVGTVPKEWLV